MKEMDKESFLGTVSVKKLMVKFAVPSIVAMLVGSLYNIVDQYFIGNSVGTLGNAATNIAFPFTTMCLALALLFGIGGASCFNLTMGEGNKKYAPYYAGNAIFMLVVCGVVLMIVSEIFLTPLLYAFGTSDTVLPFAQEYVRITAIGFPFMMLTTGGGHLIRADGSPKMTMICNLTGAVINTILDAIFVMGLEWGMAGAAYATIIGQIVSSIIVIVYVRSFKTVQLKLEHFKIRWKITKRIILIGMASFINQIAMMVVIVVLNNSLKYYGELSEYGSDIPLACSGIIMKINQIFFSVAIGLGQGIQPIVSFNYGAKKYDRVRSAYKTAVLTGVSMSIISFGLFQFFPHEIIAIFGNDNSETYFKFGIKFFRVFLFLTFINSLQPITATFFTSIGKSIKGVFLSLTRQIIFFLPLIVLMPLYMGIDGILYAGPAADLLSAVFAVCMAAAEFKNMKKLETA